jgi:hypothetical protein
MNIQCKCKGCKYRRLGCHTICSEYKKFKKEREIIKQQIKLEDNYIYRESYEKQYIKNLKDKCKRR